jgi:hypothetical protein
MDNTSRVAQWRQKMRDEGKEAVTVWLSHDAKLRLEDLASAWHSTTSAMVEQALAHFHPGNPPSFGNDTDTAQLQALMQETVRAMLPELREEMLQEVRGEIPDTAMNGKAVREWIRRDIEQAHLRTIGAAKSIIEGNLNSFRVDMYNQVPKEVRSVLRLYGIVTDTDTETVTETHGTPSSGLTAMQEWLSELKEQMLQELRGDMAVADMSGNVTETLPKQQYAPAHGHSLLTEDGQSAEACPPFDPAHNVLGKLCPRGHEWGTTGQSLLRRSNHRCRICENEGRREKRAARTPK